MHDDLKERLEVVERLTQLFKFERMVYICVNLISLVMLFGSALSLMLKGKGEIAELSTLFGSSGMITYSTGRLLYMWNEALKRLVPSTDEEEK